MWMLYSSFTLLSVIQIYHGVASGCTILTLKSPSASTLNVEWSSYPGAFVYLLDLRVVNSTSVPPVILMQSTTPTQKLVQGLRSGQLYQVTVKAFEILYNPLCTAINFTMTVPATSQITFSKAISSTSIKFEWSNVTGADSYILFVEETMTSTAKIYNQTYTTTSAQVNGLTPSTTYECYIYSSNSAGRGAKSNIRTILTLVQPPTGVALVPTGKSTARVSWNPVNKVLLYQVSVAVDGFPNKAPVIKTTSATSMDISNLEPCSTFTVGVSSVNAFLEPGEPSNIGHTTSTINGVTSVSTDYSCSQSTVTVTWDLVFGASMYKATAVGSTGDSLNCTSASTSCQIPSLKCGEKYLAHVTAISDDCESTSNITSEFETVPCAPGITETQHDCTSNVITFSWQHTNNTFYYVAEAKDNSSRITQCKTLDNVCHFTDTECGQFYEFTVYAVSSGCDSQVSEPKLVQTSPCLPTNVRTRADCTSDELITTWDSSAGALSYTVEAEGNNGKTYNCSSASSSCTIAGVPCGEQLSVWIVASSDHCTTVRVLGESAQTVPCPPTNVSVSESCSQDSATVNWVQSFGALLYFAVAEDASGNSHYCYSLGTNCLIKGLRCGQNYTSKVIGSNLMCNSTESQTNFMTGPCPPTNIDASRDCDADRAVILWQSQQMSGLYTAILEDQSGDTLNCTNNANNRCEIPSVPCGKKYNVFVTYDDGNCRSTSTNVSMDSVPCGPEDVRASVSCGTNELTVTWNMSASAENYTTTVSSGVGQTLHCNSTETQCTMAGLLCESSYTVTVSSITGTCSSLPSSEISVQTLPCPPTNVTTEHRCAPHPVPVLWTPSGNAKHYITVAESSTGHRAECTSNNTSCSLSGLQCGEIYTISVAGADDTCTGQQSSTHSLKTEPCPPSNVRSQVTCSDGAAQVFWSPTANAVSYSVEATSTGPTLTCSSSTSNCTLTHLGCGQAYDIQVFASDGTCPSNSSAPFRQDQVPCAPENVTTNLLCGSSDLMVSWTSSPLPLNYSVIAKPLDGNTSLLTCHTNSTSCVLSSLQCGQTYNVSVRASSGSCSGTYSPSQTVHSAPCPSQRITTVTECGANSLVASWDASSSASFYTATVTGPSGFSANCSSSNLTCSFSGLQCATTYNVQVTSQGSLCTSAPVQTVATTGPCDPVNVTSNLQCGSDTAMVAWVESASAVAYTVLAQEGTSDQYISCRSTTTSCQLDHLQCGKVYNLTVLAEDATCNSTGTRGVLITAPCPPSVQSSTLICSNSSALLSWTTMAHAKGYSAEATAADGTKVSCSSLTASCTLTDLLCSETYVATVKAQGNQCDSAPGSNTSITTAPCSPALLSKAYTCGTNTAVVSWSKPAGSISFLSQVVGEGYQDSCHTANTTCVFKNLPCGLDFNVSVQAQGAECNSSVRVSDSLQTVPCAPQNVSATLMCADHSALMTWVGSIGAVGYNVTVTGQNGHNYHCETNSTSCQIPDLHCGEAYIATVTPYSQTCTGTQSTAYNFKAGLCAPSNVTASPVCEDSAVSWSNVPGAEMFIATATADDGHTHTCSSNYSNSCNFTGLHCGETYSVEVVTVDQGCRSEPSSPVQLKAALCPPANLTGHVVCETNTVTLAWSPVTGATYVLQWEIIGSTPPSLTEHQTSNTSHSLSDLLCGERYAFYVAAQEANCRSRLSLPVEISTAPCLPTNLTVQVDCGTNNGNFSWTNSSGAGFYTVQATGQDGHVASCSSSDTSCAVKLHCGLAYSATLVASTESCNSTKHTNIYFNSAPCLPGSVVAELDCSTNTMAVKWNRTSGSDQYTAWAISKEGARLSCNTTSNNCSIHDLQCGLVYEVAVTSLSMNCEALAGSDYKVQSAPCRPENTVAELNCSTNVMTVKWDNSNTTQNFTVRATSTSGVNSTCDSSESSCSFLDLSCGQLYTFTVTGYTNVCISDTSTPTEKLTAPCPPASVSADLNCTTRSARISWSNSAAAVATAYSVQATSSTGYNASCSAVATSCYLDDLVCGQEYSVVAEAIHSGCSGPGSAPATLTTEPCVPSDVSVHYNVSAAWVSWSAAGGASSYSVQAVGAQVPAVTCDTNNTSCSLSGLQCSQIYNVTVTARNQACDRVTSDISRLMTAPCPPTNVQATFACGDLTAAASWQQSGLAVGYAAYFDDQNGHSTSCVGTASDTSCQVSGLMCGTEYDVWVKALGQPYNSSDGSVVTMTSGPCKPSSVSAITDCEARSVTASWQPGAGAASYVTVFTSSSGHATSCSTNLTSCQQRSLQCGEDYNVTVEAVGETCNSSAQMAGYLTTAPCLPAQVNVEVSCESDSDAAVSWSSTYGTANVSLKAFIRGSLQTLCTTQRSSCNVTGLSCGETYNLSLAASNEQCSLTAPTHVNLTTRPCLPQSVAVSLQCGSSTADLSWKEKSDVDLYTASVIKAAGGDVRKCNSTGSSCQFSGLDCGQMYNFTVRAYSQGCWSEISSTVFIQTEPCQPVNVSAQAACDSDTVQMSWHQAAGVVNYVVTASGSLGHMESFNTTQTALSATLPCGQHYNVTVQGHGSKCDSIPSAPFFFSTGPCTPSDVSTSTQCQLNTGSVSWSPSDGAESYVATATGLDGHAHQCLTNTTTCTWDDLHCGDEYTVVVRAKIDSCSSQASNSSVVYMSPCTPQDLAATVSCDLKAVSLTWNGSNGTKQYIVSAESGVSSVSFNTNVTTVHISEFVCGQNYNLTVTPQNQHCTGSPSAPSSVQTWPCTPSGISTMQNCTSGIVMVTWQASNGSDSYTATMQTDSGISEMCTSGSDSCSVPALVCGHNFSVSVTASNQQCNVTSTETTSLQSVPCVPTNVSALLNCTNNSAAVTWSPSRGATQYLLVTNSSHVSDSCQASDLSCLACGSSYTVQVVGRDDTCLSAPSQAVVFDSAPCQPQNLSAQLSCSSNNLAISWDAVREADHFLVSITAENGGTSEICNTTSSVCSTSNVTCGNTFTVQVTSVRAGCQSEHIQSQSIQSAPCQPQGIRGDLNCVTNSAWISWDAAPGAESYTVSAEGENHRANCTTSTNTTCEVEDLACGVLYNFTVTAKNSLCESPPSASISMQTAPCSLSSINVFAQCHNSSILVVWDNTEGMGGNTVYTATAVASDQTSLTCNHTGSSCYLHGAQCGLRYTISVAASSDHCSDLRSPPYRISMEPCPPGDVMVNASCEERSALVSWTPSLVAETYHVVATAADGHVHTCNTTSSNCSLSELHCDQRYVVFVTASHENCSSKASPDATLSTGSCQPSGVSVSHHCENQTAVITWTPSDNAEEYYSCAQAENGDMLYCHNTNPTCTIEGLDCGIVYNFSVQASDGTCNSSRSDPVQTGGVPCPPAAAEMQLTPMEMETQMLRFSWTPVVCGDTEYRLALTGNLLGDNETQFELASYWTNISYFEIPLPCSSDYVATLQSRNAAGAGDKSVPLSGTTAPCPPSGVTYSGNSSSATVSWNASVFASTYTIYDNSVTPKAPLCNTTKLSCSLVNIASHSLLITASNAAGESQPANISQVASHARRRRDLSGETPEEAPLLTVKQPIATVIVLQWSAVEGASFYNVLVTNQDSPDENQDLNVYGESVILTDLSSSSTYCFSVFVTYAAGDGPESEPVCTRTN
ncbi:serine-rich adhesin for platelets-like [Kryptolebias marmoratus]|uniref:serine-rich adhesin for platelets-like n=1 Tax=Kryptolebias marmoratus TaxID=37003 RepID=UPI0007F924FC|nr:serine-rich adhesin for platelets-like [Kryptolebias marmoratus]